MSTQHPDNVNTPFFSDSEVLAGETEVKEAYYAFSHLGIKEQMWDYEGKEVDNHVVEKLLSRYPSFFSENPLGSSLRLTLRVPNPAVQKGQGKLLLETLESIPRNSDIAEMFGSKTPPIFEVILPMTTSSLELTRIKEYYEKAVVGKAGLQVAGTNVSDWIGKFFPESINLIPLVEDKNSLLSAHKIAGEYALSQKLPEVRVFLARSDPALNYGAASAVLYVKIALQNLHEFGEKNSISFHPIIGVGSAPFRGNLKPTNMQNCGSEYPSVQTYTLQSSFKYDYPENIVRNAVEKLNETRASSPLHIDSSSALSLAEKITPQYQKEISALSESIISLSRFAPSRRARKLHIGLFGYSRQMNGLQFPRAIPFCAALYSLGIPPEILGLSALSANEIDKLREIYVNIDDDMKDSLRYLNKNNLEKLPASISQGISNAAAHFNAEKDLEYLEITSEIFSSLHSGKTAMLPELMLKAAWKRNFLG